MNFYLLKISFYAKKGLKFDLLKQLCDYVEILNIDKEVSFNTGFMINESKKYRLSMLYLYGSYFLHERY